MCMCIYIYRERERFIIQCATIGTHFVDLPASRIQVALSIAQKSAAFSMAYFGLTVLPGPGSLLVAPASPPAGR